MRWNEKKYNAITIALSLGYTSIAPNYLNIYDK